MEHICIQNIKKLYKHSGKCDDQQQFKDILEDAIVYTPEGFTNNSPCLFTNILDVKKKTSMCQFGSVKSDLKAIKSGTTPWALKKTEKKIQESTII